MDALAKIADTYTGYYKLLNKEESITVISASELSEDQKARLIST